MVNRRDDIDAMLAATGSGDDGFRSVVVYKLKQMAGELEALEALISSANESGILYRIKKLEGDLTDLIHDGFPEGDYRKHGDGHTLTNKKQSDSEELSLEIRKKGILAILAAAVPFVLWAVWEALKVKAGLVK